jgi:hypothetical protein
MLSKLLIGVDAAENSLAIVRNSRLLNTLPETYCANLKINHTRILQRHLGKHPAADSVLYRTTLFKQRVLSDQKPCGGAGKTSVAGLDAGDASLGARKVHKARTIKMANFSSEFAESLHQCLE